MERVNYYNKNIKFDRKALMEVYEILKEYEEKIDEIPEIYLYVIEDNMDKDYSFNIDNIETAELREDTKKILTYLYTNFLSTQEERIVLKQLEKIQSKQQKDKIKNQNQDSQFTIFNNKNTIENGNIEQKIKDNINNYVIGKKNNDKVNKNNYNFPVKYKKSFFKKLLNKIKRFFMNF